MYGICSHSIVPVRSEAADKAEMVTQAIFGDIYEVLERTIDDKWMKIRVCYDGYEGWIDPKLHTEVSEDYFHQYNTSDHGVALGLTTEVIVNDVPVRIHRGSTLPFFENGHFKIGDNRYEIDQYRALAEANTQTELVNQYIGTPYLWGGKSPFGIDCSGLAQQVMRMCGVKIKRDAWQQAEEGELVDRKNVQPGDLAFFNNFQGRIIHVGIMISKDEIVHAHGFVRLSKMDENGIIKWDGDGYTHHLSHFRRY